MLVSNRLLACALIVFAVPYASIALSADADLSVMEIGGLYQKDGKGLYDQVVSAASAKSDVSFKIQHVPPKRAFANFETGKSLCMAPANTNPDFYNFSFKTVQSASMTEAKVYIFTKAGSSPVSDVTALKGMKVGVRQGMPYGNNIENSGLSLVAASSIETNIKKLNAGRIDVFLAYWPDVYAAFDAMGVDPLPHAADQPVAVHNDSILCRDTPEGRAAIEAFDKGYKAIEGDGTLAKIMGG